MYSSDPLVSVVIPVYNGQSTIERALKSVSEQSYRNLEIIVVDDGSTDQTPVLLDHFSEKESRLICLSQKNAGVSAARNHALSRCRGKYIRFVDADDTLPASSLERMVSRTEKDRSELIIGGYTEYVDRLSREKNLLNRDDLISFSELAPILCGHANSYYFGVLWNKLFRADLIREHQLQFIPELWWGEDFAFVMDYLRVVNQVSLMREPVYDYRRNPTSTTFRQVLDCVIHPIGNIQMKRSLYGHLKGLYLERGVFESYQHTLWLYLFRLGLN